MPTTPHPDPLRQAPARLEEILWVRLLAGKGVVGTVAKTGLPLRIADTHLDARDIRDDRSRRSELAVPMLAKNQVIGVIDSEQSQPRFFTDAHEKTLITIAAVTASRIGRAWFEPTP
jgi:putative methionine-R-sulfoxide reductase with GAF domain